MISISFPLVQHTPRPRAILVCYLYEIVSYFSTKQIVCDYPARTVQEVLRMCPKMIHAVCTLSGELPENFLGQWHLRIANIAKFVVEVDAAGAQPSPLGVAPSGAPAHMLGVYHCDTMRTCTRTVCNISQCDACIDMTLLCIIVAHCVSFCYST